MAASTRITSAGNGIETAPTARIDGWPDAPGEFSPDLGVAAVFDFLNSRRSIAPKRLTAPGPSPEELAMIVATGLTAPDHCQLRPWRFRRVPDTRRADLADLFAEEKRQFQPDATEAEVEAERERAFNAPALVAVLIDVTVDVPKVPVHEQYISLGAAVGNILLAAHALGYGAMLTSGRKIESPLLQKAFCSRPRQRLIGFLSIGTPTRAAKPRTPVALADHLADWCG